MLKIGVKELLEAGVHFGHQTRRWNPKMQKYIFDARHGIHIIDLNQTVIQLEKACRFLADQVRGGREILFVGTKKQAQAAVRETAQEVKQLYITQRWLGGALTNFNTVKKSIERLNRLEKMETDGTMSQYVKQEQSALRREAARLRRNLDGMRTMQRYPAAMFIVDPKREYNAVAEAHRLNIPIVAFCDTNCDPTIAEYPIPANDDGIRSIRAILDEVKRVIAEARGEYEAKSARSTPETEAGPETMAEAGGEAAPATAGEAPGPETPSAGEREPLPTAETVEKPSKNSGDEAAQGSSTEDNGDEAQSPVYASA